MTTLAVAVALTVGFLAGLLTFKVKQRWCAECGLALRCPRCPSTAASPAANGPRPG